ncbi:MAG: Ig-like domain-containing protein [Paludibacteraceae bacterium]|nr:Ig-like domain-containing protein [Paludibacteraceae bacterium]
MKNKLTLLFALLCASMMGWAVQYCEFPTGHLNDANFGDANGRILLTLVPTGNANEYQLSIKPNSGNGNTKQLDYLYAIIGDGGTTTPYPIVAGTDENSVEDELSATFTYTGGVSTMTIQWSYPEWGGRWQCTLENIDLSALEACGGGGDGPALTDPELSLNSTAETLDASTSETFQIVATQSGDGAVSYESSNAGVASVSNTGLVTAVGRGTATITVRTEETATYAAGSKTLTVTVTGPINWEAVAWLQNSDKYKLVVDPEIGNQFGGIRKDGDNLWVGFPSAAFGAMSIEPNGGAGAYRTFALSNFTQQLNQFTVVCDNVTYTFDVYYADGEPADLTGFNLAKGKTANAGHVAEAGIAAANDGNKGTRWGSNGASHYAAVGESAGDWWYVDLGGTYRVDQVKILFETAAPTDYDILISNNAVSWTVIGTYTEQPQVGNTDENYNVYNFTNKVGRYVKIFARQGYNNMAYGFSMWEFEVYGDRATISDVNPPVMGTASLSGTSYDRVNIAVTGTDEEDGIVASFHVVDATHGVDQVQAAEAGVITVTGLTAETSYTFTITALDAAGNESANSVNVAATTTQDTSIPLVAAPVPSATGKEIVPIYSDAFASILEHEFDKDGFAGPTLMMEQNISGDHSLVYNVAGDNEVTWGMYDDGANAIIAQEAYRGSGMGVDASAMEYLHIDIWSLQAGTNAININVNDAPLTSLRLSHNGNGWQSYDIALSDFNFNPENPAFSSDNVRWMKFNGISFITGKMALDNVYFWKTAAGLQSVSATANNATYGTASVVVTETGLAPEGGTVADGTEVTFSAVANDGYVFVDWSNGNTNATFNATVDASMNLTANFRALGTTYCNTEMTVNDHTIYLTVKRSDVDEYTMIVRSAEELTNFGGTVFYRPENILVKDVRNEGVLSDGNHTLTVTMDSEGEPYFGTPLYVVFAGVGEVTYNQLLNVRPEYAVACDDAVSVTSIALSQNSANLLVGRTLTLTPTFTPAYATDRALTWETSNASVATVVDGVVTAQAAGTATITARLTSDNTVYATCAITVVDALTETVWHGYAVANPSTEGNILLTYTVTRDVEQHLTFSLTTDKDLLGFVAFINIGGVAHELTGYGAAHTATFTTTDTYEDNINLNCMWDVRGAGYGKNFNFTYMVGSENQEPNVLAIYEAQDNTSALAAHNNMEVVAVSVNRMFTAGNLYTLVLPFDIDETTLAEKLPGALTRLNNTYVKDNGDLRLNFVNASSLEAGVPYLYTPSADVKNPIFTDVTISSTLRPIEPADNYAKYYGIYTTLDGDGLHSLTNAYVLGSDRYLYRTADLPAEQTMKALRGYFVLNFPVSGPGLAPRARVVFENEEIETPTDVEQVLGENASSKILRSGVLYILRDGKMYNAQGQLIESK